MVSPHEQFEADEDCSRIELKDFLDTLERWSIKPWHDDDGMAACATACLELLPPEILGSPDLDLDDLFMQIGRIDMPVSLEFLRLIHNYLSDLDDAFSVDSQTNVSASYKVRKLYHALRFVRRLYDNKELMNSSFGSYANKLPPDFKYKYPDDYHRPEAFLELISTILDSPPLIGYLHQALDIYPIQTTVIQRYALTKVELSKQFGDKPIRIGSVGFGAGYGEKALVANLPFDKIKILNNQVELEVDNKASHDFNILAEAELNIQQLMAFDIRPGLVLQERDIAHETWIESSLLLKEHKDATLMKKYATAAKVKDERLSFNELDITDDDKVDEFIQAYTEQHGEAPNLDVFIAITVLYQLKSEAKLQAAFRNMAKFLSPEGFILIQDSRDGNFEEPYSYWAYKYWPNQPERDVEILAFFDDDRCQKIILK